MDLSAPKTCFSTDKASADAESEWVARSREGDSDAFRRLVEEHSGWLYSYHYRLVGGREEAEDLVQETFLKAWKGIGSFRTGRPFRPWLFAIAHNVAHSALRKPRKVHIPLDEPDAPEPADPDSMDSRQQARLLAREVEKIVASLPLADRELFHLRYHEGLGPGELANLLGKTEGAISASLYRLKEKIRGKLDQPPSGRTPRHDK